VRADGHLEIRHSREVFWLRADRGVQYVKNESWTSFVGTTKDTDEFGQGGSTTSISKGHLTISDETPKDIKDKFITSGCPATGTWELVDVPDKAGELVPTVRVQGDGHFSAGAFEDDDILYHGSGARKGVEVEVPLSTLQRDYTHTPFLPTVAVDAAHHAAQDAAAARVARFFKKRWRERQQAGGYDSD
jgi:hypothetical protein